MKDSLAWEAVAALFPRDAVWPRAHSTFSRRRTWTEKFFTGSYAVAGPLGSIATGASFDLTAAAVCAHTCLHFTDEWRSRCVAYFEALCHCWHLQADGAHVRYRPCRDITARASVYSAVSLWVAFSWCFQLLKLWNEIELLLFPKSPQACEHFSVSGENADETWFPALVSVSSSASSLSTEVDVSKWLSVTEVIYYICLCSVKSYFVLPSWIYWFISSLFCCPSFTMRS